MAQTQYITVTEWNLGLDERVMADLSSDDGTVGTVNDANSVLVNCIERASADVESFALRGGRYTVAALTDLQTDDDWTLKGLVADLATGYLYQIRGGQAPPDIGVRIDRARVALEELGKGSRVFRDADAIDAGQAQVSVISSSDRKTSALVGDGPNFPLGLTRTV